jgi:hypothetical protein
MKISSNDLNVGLYFPLILQSAPGPIGTSVLQFLYTLAFGLVFPLPVFPPEKESI